MLEKFNGVFNLLNEEGFIEALYNGKIEKEEHIKRLQRALELMGIKKEQKGGTK